MTTKKIQDITIKDVHNAAEQNAEKYIDRAKTIAERAFIEGVMWAQKYNWEGPTC